MVCDSGGLFWLFGCGLFFLLPIFIVLVLVVCCFFLINGKELEISKNMHVGTCGYKITLLFQKQFSLNSASLLM